MIRRIRPLRHLAAAFALECLSCRASVTFSFHVPTALRNIHRPSCCADLSHTAFLTRHWSINCRQLEIAILNRFFRLKFAALLHLARFARLCNV
mmetsp:Transcript_46108/g.76805  ORF Transcript_46108/g.76805 Transcript_46108/m.76805 type:complete len:94 (+) Transcript_46108:1081-1362(+)